LAQAGVASCTNFAFSIPYTTMMATPNKTRQCLSPEFASLAGLDEQQSWLDGVEALEQARLRLIQGSGKAEALAQAMMATPCKTRQSPSSDFTSQQTRQQSWLDGAEPLAHARKLLALHHMLDDALELLHAMQTRQDENEMLRTQVTAPLSFERARAKAPQQRSMQQRRIRAQRHCARLSNQGSRNMPTRKRCLHQPWGLQQP